MQVFFITNHENVDHQKIQKVINENRDKLKFLVTTSSDGELNFYKHHKGTRKHVQKILLPLKDLWANPPKKKQINQQTTSTRGKKADVPMNYPILFPVAQNKIATFLYQGEFFILSSKKQLLQTYLSDNYYNKNYYEYYNIHHGYEVLVEDISVKPKGCFALARNRLRQYIICQYQPDKRLLSKLNVHTKEYSEVQLTGKQIPHDFKLMYFNKKFHFRKESSPWLFELDVDGTINLESVKNDHEITKSQSKIESELQKRKEPELRF